MAQQFSIAPSAIAALVDLRRTFEPRVRSAAIKHAANKTRFVPFSIWIAGKSGIGKSVTMNYIQEWLMKALEKEPDKYELPGKERYFFAANFTQEFHTGYNGQYLFAIDDMCQDKPGTLRNSSALQFIQWVSNIPANVTQAALEDKRCPFTSKVILCSSNVTHPNRTAEIVEQEAFLRRRHVLIYAAESDVEDPTLKRKVKFSFLDPKREANCIQNPICTFDSFGEMMVSIVRAFKNHFREQKALEDAIVDAPGLNEFLDAVHTGPAHPEDMAEAMADLEEDPSETVVAEASADYKLPVRVRWQDLVRACRYSGKKLCDLWDGFKQSRTWKIVAGVSAIGVIAFGFYKWSHSLNWKDFQEKVEDCECIQCEYADASYGGPKVVRKGKIVKTDPSYNKALVRARGQPKIVALRSSFVESLRMKNLVKITKKVGDAEASLNAVFVCGRKLLTCRHFFYGMEDGEKFSVTEYPQYDRPHTSGHMFVKEKLVRVVDAQDAVIYELGGEVTCHKDIVNKFYDCDMPRSIQASSIGVYPNPVWQTGLAQVITRRVEHALGPNEDDEVVMVEGFEMMGIAEKGRSGALLASDETHNRAPTIFGIQVSISQGRNNSYFEAISRKQILATLAAFEPVLAERSLDCHDQVPEEMAELCKSSLVYVGRATIPVHQMRQTMLRRSIIADRFQCDETLKEYLPAALSYSSPGVDPSLRGTNVLHKSISGFERRYGVVDEKLAYANLDEFVEEDKSVRRHRILQPRLLTKHEVLNGIVGHGLKGIELNTSPGLPLLHQKKTGKVGKRTWIEMDDNQERIMDEKLWGEFDASEALLKKGVEPDFIAYACLKDELLPKHKVWNLKTRTFIVLPLIMNLLIRKYFGLWIAVQHAMAGTISSCVGVDVNSDWTDLKKRLLSVGTAVEDFDYTEWDRSLHAEWFGIYADRVSRWYHDRPGSEGWKVRRTLMDILAHMRIQVGPYIVQTYGGNKSGCAITAEVNTDIHDMLAYYVWCKICRQEGKQSLANLESFRDNVALALYGDDMLKCTTKAVAKWYNGTTIRPHVEELGMIITPGNKEDTEFLIKRISDVTFLKRRFLEFDEDFGQVRAPLDKSVIQRMMLWVHKSDDPIAACKANLKGALLEAFFWGEDFFNDFRDRARDAWDQDHAHGEHFPVVSYQCVKYNWLNRVHGELMPAQFQFRVVERLDGPTC